MSYTVDDALAQYATILEAVDPSPLPPPAASYAYPRDKDIISFTTLPVIITAERLNVDGQWWTKAVGVGQDRWTAEILVYLAGGPLVNDDLAMQTELETQAWRWRRVIADLLYAKMTLNGRVDYIGGDTADSVFFTHRTGHIYWLKQQFWGMRIQQVVHQNHLQTMTP